MATEPSSLHPLWGSRTARMDIDDGEAARSFIVDVQLAHIPGRGYVVGDGANGVVVDDRECQRVDHVHGPCGAVRHVNARRELTQGTWHDTRHRVGVDVERGGGQRHLLNVWGGQHPNRLCVNRGCRRLGHGRRRPHDRKDHGRGADDGQHEENGGSDTDRPGSHQRSKGAIRQGDPRALGRAHTPTSRRPGGE